MNEAARAKLVTVLEASRMLVALPDNDFSWSSWGDTKNALAEIDGLIAQLKSGTTPQKLDVAVIFAPTGPMQELALSSGWGAAFLVVADKFDEAAAELWDGGGRGGVS